MSVKAARAALEALGRAEQGVTDAEKARDDAAAALDAALAATGWTRFNGAFSPGATPRYEHLMLSSTPLTRAQVFRVLEQQAALA